MLRGRSRSRPLAKEPFVTRAPLLPRLASALALLGLLALAALPAPARAAEAVPPDQPDPSAQPARTRLGPALRLALGNGQAEEMMRKVELVRQAGLSYAPDLVLPLGNDLSCKSPEDLRILAGVLGFDANYALAFGHKDIALQNREYARAEVTGRLPAAARVEPPALPEAALRALQDNPDDPEARRALAEAGTSAVERMIAAADQDPEVLDLLLDGLYGSTIEGLAVVGGLALTAEPGPEMVMVFDEQAARLRRLLAPLDQAAADPGLDALLEAAPRRALLAPVLARIETRQGRLSLDDVQWILDRVTPERRRLAAPCP